MVKPILVAEVKAEIVVLHSLSALPLFGVLNLKCLQKPYLLLHGLCLAIPTAHNAKPFQIADVRVHIVMRITASTVIYLEIYTWHTWHASLLPSRNGEKYCSANTPTKEAQVWAELTFIGLATISLIYFLSLSPES